MKKKILLFVAIIAVIICAFAMSVNADEVECTEHIPVWTVNVGANGFLGDITAKSVCNNCKTTVNETLPPIFISLGYSSSKDGVVQSYAVNREALAKYEELTKTEVSFGAVITTRNAIGDQNPLNSKGEPINEKVKTVDFTDTKYDIIDVAVRGIPNDLKDSAEIIFAMYLKANSKITYIDNCVEKVDCGARSYEEVEEGPKAEDPSLNNSMFIDGKLYEQLDLDFTMGYFWNNSNFQTSTDQKFRERYWGTNDYFTKETLPNGSLIFVDSTNGWQYRPHKWASGTRPGNTKDEWVEVNDQWWGTFTKVGFNISLYKGSTSASDDNGKYTNIASYTEEQIAQIFKIFVPVTIIAEEPENPSEPDVPVVPNPDPDPTPDPEPDTPTETPDYSDQKQNWNDDKVLKILTIGNSFSDDSMEYVYQVARAAGVENVVLGNLYIGGCSLATHLSNASNDSASYTYRTNTTGTWSSTGGYTIKKAVESDDWDFISFQQASGYSGIVDTYSDLVKLMNIVEPLNPSARLVWHMTWAYQSNSSHSDFSKYNKNQMTMYNAILNAVQTKVVTNDRIEIVIPAGTAIQNARTSYVGDTLTRDGYHLSYDLGRFIGSLTFVKALTGLSIDNITYMPNGVDASELLMAIESVNNAVKTPFSVTTSQYASEPTPEVPEIPEEELVELPVEYLGLIKSAYYNSSDKNAGQTPISHENSTAGNLDNFYATKLFTKETLPVGSVIYIASKWQYRPERWPGSRPNNTSTERVTVDASWWDEETERAFNISLKSGGKITGYDNEDIGGFFKIYVPKSALEANKPLSPEEPETPEQTIVYVKSSDCVAEVTVIEGKEYRALTADAMGLNALSYYWSEKQGPTLYLLDQNTGNKFFATGTFTKETLPDGAVIYVSNAYQYRPEGWKSELSTNSSSTRPGNVSTNYVTVNDEWWGNWTIRAFNISKDNTPSLVGVSADEIYSNFKIYIPVENIQD